MYYAQKQIESETEHYQIGLNEELLTFAEVFEKWKGEPAFREYYHHLLADSDWEAFFWEHPPITLKDLNQTYEFKLINSKSLARNRAIDHNFFHYFSERKMAVSFDNLGGDARLIVPSHQGEEFHYQHLATFVRHIQGEQLQAFWQEVGEECISILNNRPRWISTSGLGVLWLHIRLDEYPKYYVDTAYQDRRYFV